MPEQSVEQELYQPHGVPNTGMQYNSFFPPMQSFEMAAPGPVMPFDAPSLPGPSSPHHIFYPLVSHLKAKNHGSVLYVKLQTEMVSIALDKATGQNVCLQCISKKIFTCLVHHIYSLPGPEPRAPFLVPAKTL